MADNNNNRKLQAELNKLLEKIKLTNQEKCNKVLHAVFPEVIKKMCDADCLFKKMYKRPVYTGSYYEKLRIKDACEFDINIVLALPANMQFVKVDSSPYPPSYALLCLERNVTELNLGAKETNTLKSLMEDKYLLPGKVLSWIQGVIDRADLKSIHAPNVKEIKYTSSGPAKTICIMLDDTDATLICVDLVPAFCFPYSMWPKEMKNENHQRANVIRRMSESKRSLYLVPKTYKRSSKQSPHEPAVKNIPKIWRMHFADMERALLEVNLAARPVIKLLKLLRDSQKWNNIHSYFLKTLVLNEIYKNPNVVWSNNDFADKFLLMLDILAGCCEKRDLKHFFFTTTNLFQYLNECECQGTKNRLMHIKKKINADALEVNGFFSV